MKEFKESTQRTDVLVVLIVAMFFIVLWKGCAFGASVQLQWDANTETDLAGYNVYRSTSSGMTAPVKIPVGMVTTSTVSGLSELEEYYFAVTAYNTGGLESTYSNVVYAYFLKPPTSLKLSSVAVLATTATIGLSWTPTTKPTRGTRIYWGNYSGNSKQFIFTNRTTVTGTSATIQVATMPSKKWFFRAASLDATQESWWSNFVNVNFIKPVSGLQNRKSDWR